MLSRKDLVVMACLRGNARQTLTDMSKRTNIPISTIYDRLKMQEGDVIVKHTALLDFGKLGFHTRADVVIKVDREQRDSVREFLMKSLMVNSVFKINNGYDFLFEGIWRHVKDMEDFLEGLESRFNIKTRQVYYIIDDLKKEGFLSDPQTVDLLNIR